VASAADAAGVVADSEAAGHGGATVETATVLYGRDGEPVYGVLFADLPDGRRAVAKITDPATLAAAPTDGFLGSPIALSPDGTAALAAPVPDAGVPG